MFHLERLLCRNIINLTKNNHLVSSCNRIDPRYIYSLSKLGIDKYAQDRNQAEIQMQGKEDNYRERMNQVCSPKSHEFVFTNDMKIMVYLAESDNDLELFKLMMEKYNNPSSQIRFSSYVVGPQIMRLYHYLGKPLEAMAAFEDEKTGTLFDQVSSYVILLDLLYKHEFYEEVCKIFYKIVDKQLAGNSYNKDCVLLYFAACLKLNTPEIFEEAKKVWMEMNRRTPRVWYRIKQLFVKLAINQNEPNVALEVLSEMQIDRNEIISLHLLALAQVERLEDVLFHLRSLVLRDSSDLAKVFVTKDTFEKLEPSFKNNEKFLKELKNVEEQYRVHNLIKNEPLEELLTAEIVETDDEKDRKFQKSRSSFRL